MIASAIDGRNIERNGTVLQLSTLVTPLVYPCADGEVRLIATSATLVGLMPVDDRQRRGDRGVGRRRRTGRTYESRMLTDGAVVHRLEDVRAAVTAFTRMHPKMTLFEGGIARGVTLAPVNTVADVLRARAPRGPRLLGRPCCCRAAARCARRVRSSRRRATPVAWTRPAPDLGEHTGEVLDGVGVRSPAGRPWPRLGRARRPASVRGRQVRRLLVDRRRADHRQGPRRPRRHRRPRRDTTSPADRLRLVGPFKDGVPGINRCHFFGAFNTSKLSLQLDLKHPVGIEVARRLLSWCDVCLDSFTAGTMNQLGLGYDVARELNPRHDHGHDLPMGQYGPAAELAGYGYHAASVCGFYEVTGWDDRPPGGPFNAYTDTIAPRFLTATLLAALDHRRRTGEGQFIDQAQMESSLHFLGPELLDVQVRAPARGAPATCTRRARRTTPTRAPATTSGARSRSRPTSSGARCGPCLGDPAWAARPGARHGRRPPRPARAHRPRARRRSPRATTPRALMDRLQAAGVPAGMVAALERPPGGPAARPPPLLPPARAPRDGPRALRGPRLPIAATTTAPASPRRASASTPTRCSRTSSASTTTRSARVLASGACG